MNRKKNKKEIFLKQQKEPSKITLKLNRACIFGGSLAEIKRLVAENEYTIPELEHAVSVLRGSVTSALENNLAEEAEMFLKKIIKGKKLLKRI
ncbi:MAG: hypothetical protein L3J35_00430 [Bacteroidales bacterium]|nr:hypothetical protein [Bacteroidales bacterium]